MIDTTDLLQQARAARRTLSALTIVSSAQKNAFLTLLATRVVDESERILAANADDINEARADGMEPAMLDRLLLTPDRLAGIAADVRGVAALPDPIGEEIESRLLPNGLRVSRRRVPLGVIGVIYESRPNVTVDVSVLCLKSGNAVILRGGKEARRSNAVLAGLVKDALAAAELPEDAAQFVADPDRALVGEMLRMRGEIDLIVPRGGKTLIEYVRENAQVPVLAGGVGVCHTYVDEAADILMAVEVVHNAKTRRPTVCNALDTVLVDASVAGHFLPMLAERWAEAGVEMRADTRALAILQRAGAPGDILPASPSDFGQEFLALRAAIKVVDGLDEAIGHIEEYGSGHSEAIVTESYTAATEFVNRIDAAAVYVNASTQFTDGAQFGLGAELGISTQKLHARGPIGLREMTSYKWVVLGQGQVRPG